MCVVLVQEKVRVRSGGRSRLQQCDLKREGQGNLELFGLGLRHVLWLMRTRPLDALDLLVQRRGTVSEA
jgi:hypothetical protein